MLGLKSQVLHEQLSTKLRLRISLAVVTEGGQQEITGRDSPPHTSQIFVDQFGPHGQTCTAPHLELRLLGRVLRTFYGLNSLLETD